MAIVDGFVDRVADRKTERMGALLVIHISAGQ